MERTKNALILTVIIFFALIICYPIWFALTGAISSQWELEENLSPIFSSGRSMASWPLLPKSPTLRSLVEVLLDCPGFFPMFWNSVKITFCILLGQLLIDIPAAWALARFPLPAKNSILTVYIVLMLMPFQVLMFPQYLVLDNLNVLDTVWSVILPGIFSTFPVFLLYRFFLSIPQETIEAARLDGAGEIRIFLRIGIPLGAPGILSVTILTFLDSWNMIEQPMIYLKTKSQWPLALFLPEITLSDMGMGFAAALLMLIPALLMFLNCQEYLEQGIALSGGKE